MKALAVLVVALLLPLGAAAQLVRNPTATPGKVRALTASQVCSIKWGTDRRHVTRAMKRRVATAYGAFGPTAGTTSSITSSRKSALAPESGYRIGSARTRRPGTQMQMLSAAEF